MKPFSQAAENNRGPILEVLKSLFHGPAHLLEVGSGTGQHAVYFAEHWPDVVWQTSDRWEHHDGILAWLNESKRDNALPPITLDVLQEHWPDSRFDGGFSANTAHIMNWAMVVGMFTGMSRSLKDDGLFVLYGPFNYGGRYTSAGNERFDQQLRSQETGMGIRDFEAIEALANAQAFELFRDVPMPANNRSLVWRRRARDPLSRTQ